MNKTIIALMSAFALVIVLATLHKMSREPGPKLEPRPTAQQIEAEKRRRFEECRERALPMVAHCLPKCEDAGLHGITLDECLDGCALVNFDRTVPRCARLLD